MLIDKFSLIKIDTQITKNAQLGYQLIVKQFRRMCKALDYVHKKTETWKEMLNQMHTFTR